jgi:hypothetical protein
MNRFAAVSIALLALVGSASCSDGSPSTPSQPAPESPPSSASPFAARPAELKLDAVDPCALLTGAQQGQLGVPTGKRFDNSDEFGSTACQWANHAKPDNRWLARLIVKRGADYALGSTTGVQVVQIGGFSAVQTAAPYQDPNTNCVLVVDIAQGQSLGVQYGNAAGDYPGINHDVACQLDRKAAELMVQNLRALAH